MKIRSGFVSNSSSSSFLISLPKRPDTKLEDVIERLRKDHWIFSYEKAQYSDECKMEIELATKEFNRGYELVHFTFSTDDRNDETLCDLVNKFGGIVKASED